MGITEIICYCFGVVIGIVISIIWMRSRFAGSIRIHTDEDGQSYPFMEINKGKSNLIFSHKKLVVFRTNCENYISHK